MLIPLFAKIVISTKKKFSRYNHQNKFGKINLHRGNDENKLIICDGCSQGYHLGCLSPKLKHVPRGKWLCFKCNPKLPKKPIKNINVKTPPKIAKKKKEEISKVVLQDVKSVKKILEECKRQYMEAISKINNNNNNNNDNNNNNTSQRETMPLEQWI